MRYAGFALVPLLLATAAMADGGVDSIKGQYSPSKPHWHEYDVTVPLCNEKQNDKCSMELLKKGLLRNAVPCQNPSQEIKSGDVLEAIDPNFNCMLRSAGKVRVTLHDNGMTAVNQTLEGHVLYNGIVIRSLVRDGSGQWSIHTRGVGNNSSDLMAALNKSWGPVVFKTQDGRFRGYLEKCLQSGGQGCN